jgi:hypothetical protein
MILCLWENQRAKAAYPPLPEVAGCRWHPFSNDRNGVEILPPDEGKVARCRWHLLGNDRSGAKTDANGYICGLVPILYIHCIPCRIVLHNLQGKKIAAIIRTNDG